MSETEYARPFLQPRTSGSSITFRTPSAEDGAAVWRAVQQAGTLEPNTAYFYLIFCSDFCDTCLIAEDGDDIAGVLIGYHPPTEPDTAFCWQIGVLPPWRGKGLGKHMLAAWLDLPANKHVQWLTATVANDNAASDQLFQGFASSRALACTVKPHFTADHFPAGHSPEPMYRIGPIRSGAHKRT